MQYKQKMAPRLYTQRAESGLALPLHLLDDDHIVPYLYGPCTDYIGVYPLR